MNPMLTNRAKLLQTNEYDLLMKLNDNLRREQESNYEDIVYCVMNALYEKDRIPFMCSGNCDSCIQSWLNEKAMRL